MFSRSFKNAAFSEEVVKPSMGEHGHFEGKRASSNKNQYNLFYRKWGFKYFSLNNFFQKKKNSKITAKNNFTIFEAN